MQNVSQFYQDELEERKDTVQESQPLRLPNQTRGNQEQLQGQDFPQTDQPIIQMMHYHQQMSGSKQQSAQATSGNQVVSRFSNISGNNRSSFIFSDDSSRIESDELTPQHQQIQAQQKRMSNVYRQMSASSINAQYSNIVNQRGNSRDQSRGRHQERG